MKRLRSIWFWLAAVPASCSGACSTVTPTPTPAIYSCETYCAHAVDMGCDFAQPTPAGTPSVDFGTVEPLAPASNAAVITLADAIKR